MNAAICCRRCQTELSPAARFCPSCGKEQLAAEPTLVANTELASPAAQQKWLPLPPMRLLPSTLLAGVYSLGNVIGEGGMGKVYRAHDPVSNERLAVKVLGEIGDLVGIERIVRHEEGTTWRTLR